MPDGTNSPDIIDLKPASSNDPLKPGEYRVLDSKPESPWQTTEDTPSKKIQDLFRKTDEAVAKADKKISQQERQLANRRNKVMADLTEQKREAEIEEELQRMKNEAKTH